MAEIHVRVSAIIVFISNVMSLNDVMSGYFVMVFLVVPLLYLTMVMPLQGWAILMPLGV